MFVAIYWINHHNLLTAVRYVNARLIWANNALLFCLSLIPFATAYVAETDMAPFPTMVYGALQFACAIPYNLLVAAIGAGRRDDGAFMAVYRARRRQDFAVLAAYLVADRAGARQPGRGARPLRADHALLCRARPGGRRDAAASALSGRAGTRKPATPRPARAVASEPAGATGMENPRCRR